MRKAEYVLITSIAIVGVVTLRGVNGGYGLVSGATLVGLSVGVAYLAGFMRGSELL